MSAFDPIGCCGKFGASTAYSCCACRPNRRGLASAYPKITLMFYVHAEAVRPQKSRRAADKFSSVGLGRPPFRGTECGTQGEDRIDFTAGSATPNDGRPGKRLVWGKRQSRWLPWLTALLSELQPFFVL